jgi:hypothetical protein
MTCLSFAIKYSPLIHPFLSVNDLPYFCYQIFTLDSSVPFSTVPGECTHELEGHAHVIESVAWTTAATEAHLAAAATAAAAGERSAPPPVVVAAPPAQSTTSAAGDDDDDDDDDDGGGGGGGDDDGGGDDAVSNVGVGGNFLVTASRDKTVRIWDVGDGG